MSEPARQLSYAKALNEGLDVSMSRNERVFLIGLGVPDPTGVFGTTTGREERYGSRRVFDMPISKGCICTVGAIYSHGSMDRRGNDRLGRIYLQRLRKKGLV